MTWYQKICKKIRKPGRVASLMCYAESLITKLEVNRKSIRERLQLRLQAHIYARIHTDKQTTWKHNVSNTIYWMSRGIKITIWHMHDKMNQQSTMHGASVDEGAEMYLRKYTLWMNAIIGSGEVGLSAVWITTSCRRARQARMVLEKMHNWKHQP